MKIKKYIKSNYKGWLIGILLLLFIIELNNSFRVVNRITSSNYLIMTELKLLFLIFIISFFFFIVFSDAFGFHFSTDCTEYENEDLVRFKKNLRKSLIVYFISLLIWIITILTIIIQNQKTENLWELIYLLVFPLVVFGIIVYVFNRIKIAYNKDV